MKQVLTKSIIKVCLNIQTEQNLIFYLAIADPICEKVCLIS